MNSTPSCRSFDRPTILVPLSSVCTTQGTSLNHCCCTCTARQGENPSSLLLVDK